MSSSISRTDLNINSIPEEVNPVFPRGNKVFLKDNPVSTKGKTAPERSYWPSNFSSQDAVQLSFTAQIQRLKSNGVTPEMIAAELDLPIETITSATCKADPSRLLVSFNSWPAVSCSQRPSLSISI